MRRTFLVACLLLGGVPAHAQSIPSEIAGLRVAPEPVGEPDRRSGRREYLSEIELYSLREGDTLQATLQVGRFRPDAPAGSAAFRRSIVAQLGTGVAFEQRVRGATIHVTREKKLDIVVWFSGRHMFVLSVRDGYARPKTLVREALGVRP